MIIKTATLMALLCLLPFCSISQALADDDGPNELIKFLVGNWQNVSFEIADSKPVKKESYAESMVLKDNDTITITAHGYKNGKDLVKDMRLVLKGQRTELSQGPYVAKGKREKNVYYFVGKENGKEYKLRLYTLGDKYVFNREIWSDGRVEEVDISYLVKQK